MLIIPQFIGQLFQWESGVLCWDEVVLLYMECNSSWLPEDFGQEYFTDWNYLKIWKDHKFLLEWKGALGTKSAFLSVIIYEQTILDRRQTTQTLL